MNAISKNVPAIDVRTEDGMRHALLAYGPELRSFAARRLKDSTAAEDAVQETLLRAWKSAERFDPARGTLRGWLYGILRNLLIDLARARARRACTTPLLSEAVAVDERNHVEELLGSLTVQTALDGLSADHRQVVYHCYLRERPHAEVAALLGVPIGTVRSRLFYARHAMKDVLDADEASFDQPQLDAA